MFEDFREKFARFLIGAAILVVGIVLIMDKLEERKKEQQKNHPESFADREPVGRSPKDETRPDQIRRLQYSDPLKALEICDTILKSPKDKEEGKQALELLPMSLHMAFTKRLKAKEYEPAQQLMQRLTEQFPEHFENRSTRESWGRDLGERCRQAVKADQEVEADQLLDEILKGGHVKVNESFFKEFQNYKVKKANEAHAAGDATKAEHYLEQASRFYLDMGWSSGMVRLLGEGKWDGAVLDALAQKWSANGQAAQAIELGFYCQHAADAGVWNGANPPYKDREILRDQVAARLFQSLIKAGDEALAGHPTIVMTRKPRDIYSDALQVTRAPGQRIEACRRRLAADSKEFLDKARPVLAFGPDQMASKEGLEYEAVNKIYSLSHAAQAEFSSVAQAANQLWSELRREPGFDPWAHADVGVKARAWQQFPEAGQAEARATFLEQTYQNANWLLPVEGAGEAGEAMCQVYLRWGILTGHGSRTDCTRMLRTALAHSRNPEIKEQAARGTRSLIRRSRAQKDFEGLYELTVFYTGAFPEIKSDDPFRKDLFGCLTDAVQAFQKGSPMKRIFLLSLLNEVFPETAEGKRALTEALQQSFKAAAAQAEDTKGSPVLFASPVPGHTAIALDNDTEYHLLCFYQGPEVFFVRIPPFRRGSLLLKSGDYKVAVITTSDTVVPYRGAFTMKDEQRQSTYTVRTEGTQGSYQGFSSSATGEYSLLRAPTEHQGLRVESKTGMVLR